MYQTPQPSFPGFGSAESSYAPQQQQQGGDRRRRLLMALAGGLGSYDPDGGFAGNLFRGFGGAVGGTMKYHEQEREEVRQRAEEQRQAEAAQRAERQIGISQGHLDVALRAQTRLENQPEKVDEFTRYLRMTPQERAEYGKYKSVGNQESDADFFRRDPAGYRRFKETGWRPESTNEPLVQVAGPDGQPIYVPRSQAVGQRVPRERSLIKGQERTALAFYNRAREAEETIGGLEGKIASMPLPSQFQLRFAPNVAQTPNMQSYRQAQRAFTEARLRKESGAAIPTSEYTNDSKTYFAQPGDDPQTIAQKRAARQKVLAGMKFQSGAAYEEYYGEPNTSPGRANSDPTEEYTRVNGKLVRVK